MNRLGSRCVLAQTQVLAVAASQAASRRCPRPMPDAALQPGGPAWSHTPRSRWQPPGPRVSPWAVQQGRLCGRHGLGSRARMGAQVGWVCQRPGTCSWHPPGQHQDTEAPKEAGPEGPRQERERSRKPITLFSRPCHASWPKPGGELCSINKHLFFTPFRIKLSPTCPNCLEAIRVSTAGSIMGTGGANFPLGLWAENDLLLMMSS